ncbi:MAG TPA: hypothetical protein VFG64_08335 [Dongiaceae bacterium]|nr:hypothetical protein [Dongiaceae bacterium]
MALRDGETRVAKQVANKVIPSGPQRIEGTRISVGIAKIDEQWSTYSLADGTVLRLRPVMVEVNLIKGRFSASGEPIYEFKSGVIVDTKVPAKLKKAVTKKARKK